MVYSLVPYKSVVQSLGMRTRPTEINGTIMSVYLVCIQLNPFQTSQCIHSTTVSVCEFALLKKSKE